MLGPIAATRSDGGTPSSPISSMAAVAMPAAGATPAGVHGGNDAAAPIGDEDGHAVGDPHRDRAGRIGRDNRVRVGRLLEFGLRTEREHRPAMHLFHTDDVVGRDVQALPQPPIVLVNRRPAKLELTSREHVRRVRFERLRLKKPPNPVVNPSKACGN